MKIIYISSIFVMLLLSSCMDYFLELEDPDQLTEEVYFTEPEHFREAANYLYTRLPSFRMGSLGENLLDYASDLSTAAISETDYGFGNISIPIDDSNWGGSYTNLRTANKLIEFAEEYGGDKAEIAQEVAEAKFFRAWFHYKLMQYFGGVPIVLRSLETDSEELWAKRNSRYEVTEQIIKDLNEAIPDLPLEGAIAADNKGLVSQGAAKAFKARVLLHEATWMKYVGTTTDGDGTSTGAGSAGYDAANIDVYLAEAAEMCEDVMNEGSYELWDYSSELSGMSHYFMVNIEASNSNPLGLDKTSNKEFILYRKHDLDLFHSTNPAQSGRAAPNRKMIDMILCSDGLPIEKSSVFQGYDNIGDEYLNRDYRMRAYFGSFRSYGDYNDLTSGVPTNETVLLPGYSNADAGSGYKCQKWERWGKDDSSFDIPDNGGVDFPIIRLAEVYLTYAEALYELNGTLTDAQLNASINKTRSRAGLPALTNSFITTNGLDLLEEIRRERAVEFYAEANRFIDLRRWNIAVDALGEATCGMVVGGTAIENNTAVYDPADYSNDPLAITLPNGETRDAVQLVREDQRNFALKHYLYPVPSGQILLNNNLLQNPGY
ncbi:MULTISPECIES: RagB/SusD family nutrient uptake outer membrane protein [unclassified Saccharicrinis]|uniref:RagB/SusD family nutrient uptake outer membrane protein n=1 Tax=unclassified Saccharicrinis TaxID=2646859 RepID=UPI003D340F80